MAALGGASNTNVWRNTGTISANGFSEFGFLLELQASISIWNEESQTPGEFQYAGDTLIDDPIPGAVLIEHQNVWACSDNTSGKAFYGGTGLCAAADMAVVLIMQDSCNPGTPRQWRVGWPGPTAHDPWGVSGTMQYEIVATHELGHMHGFFDYTAPVGLGVMVQSLDHHAYMHLYTADILSLRAAEGTTFLRPMTIDSASGSGWTSPQAATTGIMVSSRVPGISGQMPDATYPMRMGLGEPWLRYAPVRKGSHGSWASHPTASSVLDVDSWVSVATSTFGELLVVWPDNCDGTNACDIDWAWTNNDGVSWSRGTLTDTGTYSRPAVEYDRGRDRFVLAYINRQSSRVFTRSAPAISGPGWSSSFGTSMAPYRFLGGMVFNSSGQGLIFAAANTSSTRGRIAQFTLSGSGSTYSTTSANWLTSLDRRTNRSFGVAYSEPQDRILVVWKDWPFEMWRTHRTGITSVGLFPSPSAFATPSSVASGVDADINRAADRFVVAFAD